MQAARTISANRLFRRQTLLMRAVLMCGAVSLLLVGEFILALMFSRTMDGRMAEFTAIDRRSQTLLNAAGKMSDFLDDLALPNGLPQNPHPVMGHFRGHLIALNAVEQEMRRQDRPPVKPSVTELIQQLSEIQLGAVPEDTFATYVRDVRTVVDVMARETLHMLVTVDNERKDTATALNETRRFYIAAMLGTGVVGAVLVLAAGISFLTDLTRRLRLVGNKARAIAAGETPAPLPNTVRDELGEVIEAMNAMARHLADRDRQLEELRLRFSQQEKMQALGTFATGMAHEIGNPIQAISAMSYQISDSLQSDPGIENVQANILLVDSIGAHADRLARTISEIRDFAHPGKPEFETVDVNEVVRATVGLMRFDPRFKRKSVTVDCRAVECAIPAVHDQLVQVVMNLLTNAADAVEANGGTVSLVTMDTDKGVIVSVADTGCGMPESVREHACDAFFTTKPRSKGTGMGLAICRSIVAAHGGTMAIASAEGFGTTITLTFPRGKVS